MPTLVALPLLVLLVWLGQWQLQRAGEKQALLDAYANSSRRSVTLPSTPAAAPRFLQVAVAGHYLSGRQVLLDNQIHNGQAGYRVLTPLLLADGSTLMVDRGWVPLPGNARDVLPNVSVPAVQRIVRGRLDLFRAAAFAVPVASGAPSHADGPPQVLNYPDAATVESAIGLPVYPRVLLLAPTAPDGFLRVDAPTVSFGPERHLGYAIQWFGLSLTLLVLWVVTAFKPTAATSASPAKPPESL